jgi:hypothetical protein
MVGSRCECPFGEFILQLFVIALYYETVCYLRASSFHKPDIPASAKNAQLEIFLFLVGFTWPLKRVCRLFFLADVVLLALSFICADSLTVTDLQTIQSFGWKWKFRVSCDIACVVLCLTNTVSFRNCIRHFCLWRSESILNLTSSVCQLNES